jgi:hypothetical protein
VRTSSSRGICSCCAIGTYNIGLCPREDRRTLASSATPAILHQRLRRAWVLSAEADAPAERIAEAEERAHERLVDDRDLPSRRLVVVRERSPAMDGDAHRLEVAWADAFAQRAWRDVGVRRRPSITIVLPRSPGLKTPDDERLAARTPRNWPA